MDDITKVQQKNGRIYLRKNFPSKLSSDKTISEVNKKLWEKRHLIHIHTSLLRPAGLHDDKLQSQWVLGRRQKPPEHLIHSFGSLNSSEDSC